MKKEENSDKEIKKTTKKNKNEAVEPITTNKN